MHGNTTAENTKINAARCLHAFAAPAHVKVYGGAAVPLIRPARHDAQIHGPDGLGGVEGLPSGDSDPVRERIDDSRPVIEAIAAAIAERTQTSDSGAGGTKAAITIIASGPLTNIALFVSVYPHLLDAVERIVFMGGGIGVGNRSAVAGGAPLFSSSFHLFLCGPSGFVGLTFGHVAEFNMLCDR